MTHPHNRPYGPRRKRTQTTETGPDLRGLDALHRRLVTDACAGNVAKFEKDEVLDADILTALITGQSYQGRQPWPVDPKGVRVEGGRVETQLDLSQTQIEWPLMLIHMLLPEGADFTQARTQTLIFNNSVLAEISLYRAVVKGFVAANDAIISNPFARALDAQGAEISDDLILHNTTLNGQCSINGTKIGGAISAYKAQFNDPDGIALSAQGAELADGLFLYETTFNGQCDISGAKIRGQVNADNASFHTPNGTALRVQDAEISGAIFLSGASLRGICDFTSARTGEIFLRNATLIGRFTACTVSQIKQLDLSRAKLISARHAQLDAKPTKEALAKLDPESAIILDLKDARIGRLDMPKESNNFKGIVNLTSCHVEQFYDHSAAWPEPLIQQGKHWITPQSRQDPETNEDIGSYDLNGFTYDYLANPNGRSGENKEVITSENRKSWLLSQKVEKIADQFNSQPWSQMTAQLEAQGHYNTARTLTIYRRQYQRRSNSMNSLDQVFVSYILDIITDYGFNPWQTFRISAAVIAVFALIYGLAAVTGPMPDDGYQPAPMFAWTGPASDANANPPPVFIRAQADDVNAATSLETLNDAEPFLRRVYPDFNPLLYSLDVFVPVLDLGMDHYWRPNPNHIPKGLWGQHWMVGSVLYWLTILQRFMGAILIAVMVTSFTGLLTREDKRG